MFLRSFSSPYFSRKCCTSSGMSSRRSRSGGQVDADDVQAIVEVFAEASLFHLVLQVDVGRGNDADVNLDRLHAAEAHELALLHHAQQLGLRLDRHVADLVEEDAALVGEIEHALLGIDRAGKGALDVAEERRFEEIRRQVARVHRHERLLAARGVAVNRARHQLLTGAALAGNQDRRAARRGLDDQVEHLPSSGCSCR